MFLTILKYIALAGTILTGVFALVAPRAAQSFTGLFVKGGRGVTEIRSIFGGLFVALGVAPLFLGDAAYVMLGIAYLGIAVVRALFIFIDKSGEPSNFISLGAELAVGIILVL